MFDWEGFENREFCVDFKNDADKIEFLKECEKRGYAGCNTGSRPTKMTEYTRFQRAVFDFNERKGIVADQSDLKAITYNPHEIDCSIAVNFAEEYTRMCASQTKCNKDCPMYVDGLDCPICMQNPQKAVEAVQKWSDEHPREKVVTYLDKLLEVFPNAPINKRTIHPKMCITQLGAKGIDNCYPIRDCKECWSQPYKENTNV